MHPYISQAIAAERVADAIRAADASRRARLGRELAAINGRQPRPSYRGRRSARSQRCTAAASMVVSGPARH
jgi:hypothetical protein